MPSRRSSALKASAVLVTGLAGAALVLPGPALARPTAPTAPSAPTDPGAPRDAGSWARGEAAVTRLGTHLPGVAESARRSSAWLRHELRSDPSLRVSPTRELAYVDPVPPAAVEAMAVDAADARAAAAGAEASPDLFALHSRPGADAVIYLDFTGHTTTGTQWNRDYGQSSLVSPPYDRTGDEDVLDATEEAVIRTAWARVAEDYAPFDVDVTTEEPAADRLRADSTSDPRRGVRAVVTTQTWSSCGCGGFAYLGSFNHDIDTPVFVFNTSADGVAEAVAHEVGHSLFLGHDRTVGTSYYAGHGSGVTSWGPIMGAAYTRSLTQWSKGQFTGYDASGANSGKSSDDLAVITTWNSFGYRPDDHGTGSGSTALTPSSSGAVSATGVVGRTTDVDGFSFSTAGGRVRLRVDPVPEHDLDVGLTLRTATGTVVATASPGGSLGATVDTTVPSGRYELDVDGVGYGTPLASPPTGYTDYGSLGQYTLTGTVPPSRPNAAPVARAEFGTSGLRVSLADTSSDGDGRVVRRRWAFGDGATAGGSRATHTYATAGARTVTLTVTDDDGATATTTIPVVVSTGAREVRPWAWMSRWPRGSR